MHAIYSCAEIHNATSEPTGNTNKTSEQHRELEVYRIKRDVKNLQIIHSWFTENSPFPENLSLYLALWLLLLHNILISTVIKPSKLVQKFMPR